jgi:hypothetical protein
MEKDQSRKLSKLEIKLAAIRGLMDDPPKIGEFQRVVEEEVAEAMKAIRKRVEK